MNMLMSYTLGMLFLPFYAKCIVCIMGYTGRLKSMGTLGYEFKRGVYYTCQMILFNIVCIKKTHGIKGITDYNLLNLLHKIKSNNIN